MGVPFPALKTMVTVFLLLMGNVSPVDPVAVSTVASIAASAITAGTSIAGAGLQTIASPAFSVTCVIQVENWTRFPMVYSNVILDGLAGISEPPSNILPAVTEAFALRKPKATATGIFGFATWELQGAKRLFILMFAAPYNFNYFSNWMGVGMTREGLVDVAANKAWLYQMYSGKDSRDVTFKRGRFYYDMNPVIYRNDKFEIVGVMTNIHKAQIKVVIRPTIENWQDLAFEIQEHLETMPEDACADQ